MIHEAHESEEQRKYIRTYKGARHNAIQLEFEYCKHWNIGKEEGWAEEEACEVGNDGGIENISSNEWSVAKIRFVGSQHRVRWWRPTATFTRHFAKILVLSG